VSLELLSTEALRKSEEEAVSRLQTHEEIWKSREKQLHDSFAEMQVHIASLQEKGQAALEAVRTASAETGVSRTASFFRTEADSYAGQSQRWLWAAIAMACTTAGFALLLAYHPYVPPASKSQATDQGTSVIAAQLIAASSLTA
jgi:hypothetical protein